MEFRAECPTYRFTNENQYYATYEILYLGQNAFLKGEWVVQPYLAGLEGY